MTCVMALCATLTALAGAGLPAQAVVTALPARVDAAKNPSPPIRVAKKPSQKGAASRRATAAGWDIVLVLTDDQPVGTLDQMPEVQRRLLARGVNYTNAIVPTSLCCPSRASLFTGQSANVTGVFNNRANTGAGGYPVYRARGNEERTIAVAMDQIGYRTAYFGKFMNEFGAAFDGTSPPGWDVWRTFAANRSGDYVNYTVGNGLKPGAPRTGPAREFVKQYSTTYFGDLATEHIRRAARSAAPLFTVFAPYAPHAPFYAPPRYRRSVVPPSYWNDSVLESDVSDKPQWIQDRPNNGRIDGRPPGLALKRQQDTLLAVDEQVGRIVDAVADAGRLDRTLFVYVSDNGYLHGEHRLDGKGTPHYKSTNVPLIVRWGRSGPTGADDRLTIANVDIAATLLAAAGLPNTTSGSSVIDPNRNAGGAQLVGSEAASRFTRPPFCGWRTATRMFVRYGSGEEEYYDYTRDPFELDNAVNDPAQSAQSDELRQRARAACAKTPPGYGPNFDTPRWAYPEQGPPGSGKQPPIDEESATQTRVRRAS